MKGHDGAWGTSGQGSRGLMGQLGHIGRGVPMCPNVPQCSVLQYNCDRLSPPKTAVLDLYRGNNS